MTYYPRCKTCRWWEPFGVSVMGKCSRLSIWDHTTICLSGENPAGHEMTGFAWTEDSFGCVHHEEADKCPAK